MMPTALLGWELGGGLGHVTDLVVLAEALEEQGWRVVLALRELPGVWPVLRTRDVIAVPAPVPPMRAPRGFTAGSFADILAVHGFSDPDALRPTLAGWDSLLALVQPDVVVADHAPALVLAARDRFPTVRFGNGFTVPPTDVPQFPPVTDAPAMTNQEHLASHIADVLRTRGQTTPETLPAAFETFAAFPCVYPALDVYQATRTVPSPGPLRRPLPPIPESSQQAFFAYLGAETKETMPTLATLAGRLPGRAYVRGASRQLRAQLGGLGVDVLEEPIPMRDALASCTLLVHHASLGAAQAGLAAGRPQLSVPLHLEQRITALRLERLGVGATVGGPSASAIAGGADRAAGLGARAAEAAQDLSKQGFAGCLNDVVTAVLAAGDAAR